MINLKNLLVCLIILSSIATQASTPVEVLVPVDHIYSPKGFDSNDNIEIIISGYLPNLCHKSPKTLIHVKGQNINIEVKSLKYSLTNPFCPQVIVPFLEAVSVGMLNKGTYQITVNGKSPYQQKSQITIAEATTNAIDDFMYAGVEYVEKIEGSRQIKLKGYNPSDCFVLDQIKFINNGKDTYSVLPKLKQVSDFCPLKMMPFTYQAKVPSELTEEKLLLHVRSMDGKSVNSLFNN